MNWFKVFVISSILLVFGYIVYQSFFSDRIAFINNAKVFSDFQMTKELDEEVKVIELSKQHVLDSLYNEVRILNNGKLESDKNNLDILKRNFTLKQNQFNDEIAKIKQSSLEKIWKQINQYISDYSKAEGYTLIFGANGQGGLMYADQKLEITDDVVVFINEKYNGKK